VLPIQINWQLANAHLNRDVTQQRYSQRLAGDQAGNYTKAIPTLEIADPIRSNDDSGVRQSEKWQNDKRHGPV